MVLIVPYDIIYDSKSLKITLMTKVRVVVTYSRILCSPDSHIFKYLFIWKTVHGIISTENPQEAGNVTFVNKKDWKEIHQIVNSG